MTGVHPTRIIAQIVTGIGFLGLGVIWKQGIGKPTGLTTAASIWVTAAIGILIGLGMWTEVLVGTVLTLIILFSKRVLLLAGLEKE
jgi:putative Mg2+ transporter-C (MgtC) family protein